MHLKRYFFSGLAVLLPLILTLLVVKIVVTVLTKPFIGLAETILTHYGLDQGFLFLSGEQTLRYSSQILTLIAFLFLVILIGLTARWFAVHYFFRFTDILFHRIPFVNKIYRACQDVVRSLWGGEKKQFGQVVLVPFPHSGLKSIGFMMQPEDQKGFIEHELISVFVPATPNPTMGFLLLFKKEQLTFVDMSVEEALKSVVSCGVMVPHFSVRNLPNQQQL